MKKDENTRRRIIGDLSALVNDYDVKCLVCSTHGIHRPATKGCPTVRTQMTTFFEAAAEWS